LTLATAARTVAQKANHLKGLKERLAIRPIDIMLPVNVGQIMVWLNGVSHIDASYNMDATFGQRISHHPQIILEGYVDPYTPTPQKNDVLEGGLRFFQYLSKACAKNTKDVLVLNPAGTSIEGLYVRLALNTSHGAALTLMADRACEVLVKKIQ
jgi:hypothetical protein